MKTRLIKSPMNYVGGKYKLLPQILPLIPNEIDTFVDLFCGGFNVGINIDATKIIGNDLCKEVIDVYRGIQANGTATSLALIKNEVNKYELSKTNEVGFRQIREYYNSGNRDWFIFYAMLTHSFNYQIRFNKQGEYNMPFGRNRSHFNASLEKHFVAFSNALECKDIEFTTNTFEDFDIAELTTRDFVYLDPPYLISCASYNEHGGWDIAKEHKLLEFCDKLNAKGIRFALSNVLEHKGLENEILKDWSNKYTVHYLNYNYNNCNYQDNNKSNRTIEVLITNY